MGGGGVGFVAEKVSRTSCSVIHVSPAGLKVDSLFLTPGLNWIIDDIIMITG